MEFEFYVDSIVPSDVGVQAIAAAMQVLGSNHVGIQEAASAARRRREAVLHGRAASDEDYRLGGIWDEATAVADAILNSNATDHDAPSTHVAVRRALNRADADARDQWLNTAAAVLRHHGENGNAARTHAWLEWLNLTHGESDIQAGLAVDPTRFANRLALWQRNSPIEPRR